MRLNKDRESKRCDYRKRFEDYEFKVIDPEFDPDCDAIDVILKTKDGDEYVGIFMTLKFMEYMFDKNKRTGERKNRTYLAFSDNPVILEKLTKENIKKAIDALIDELAIEDHFKEVTNEKN